jgi:hypothetical protein
VIIGGTNGRQQQLANQERLKEQNARDFDPSIGYALDWIEKHRDEFEMEVFSPIMISANVTNREYAWQVEMCTSIGQRKVGLTV